MPTPDTDAVAAFWDDKPDGVLRVTGNPLGDGVEVRTEADATDVLDRVTGHVTSSGRPQTVEFRASLDEVFTVFVDGPDHPRWALNHDRSDRGRWLFSLDDREAAAPAEVELQNGAEWDTVDGR